MPSSITVLITWITVSRSSRPQSALVVAWRCRLGTCGRSSTHKRHMQFTEEVYIETCMAWLFFFAMMQPSRKMRRCRPSLPQPQIHPLMRWILLNMHQVPVYGCRKSHASMEASGGLLGGLASSFWTLKPRCRPCPLDAGCQ